MNNFGVIGTVYIYIFFLQMIYSTTGNFLSVQLVITYVLMFLFLEL